MFRNKQAFLGESVFFSGTSTRFFKGGVCYELDTPVIDYNVSPIVSAAFLKFQEKGAFEKQAFFEKTLIFIRNEQPFSGEFLRRCAPGSPSLHSKHVTHLKNFFWSIFVSYERHLRSAEAVGVNCNAELEQLDTSKARHQLVWCEH